jgi:hypothetical protein
LAIGPLKADVVRPEQFCGEGLAFAENIPPAEGKTLFHTWDIGIFAKAMEEENSQNTDR